jgi:hypothetical protein
MDTLHLASIDNRDAGNLDGVGGLQRSSLFVLTGLSELIVFDV